MSDPRENLPIDETIKLLEISPLAELGIQAHPTAMTAGMPRNKWMNKLLNAVQNLEKQPNLALHVNYDWCTSIITNGRIPTEIENWMGRKNTKTNIPLIQRIQLNIGDNTGNINENEIIKVLNRFPNCEFIFAFNNNVKNQIDALKKHTTKFKLLFDQSYGAGKQPDHWAPPIYDDIQFGYAGGLSPENVANNMDKISNILPEKYETWIDAEGQLRRNNTFDIELARNYLLNALKWNKYHTK